MLLTPSQTKGPFRSGLPTPNWQLLSRASGQGLAKHLPSEMEMPATESATFYI